MNRSVTWEEFNQASLQTALGELHAWLTRFLAPSDEETGVEAPDAGPEPVIAQPPPSLEGESEASALDTLCAAFGLSGFERRIVLMCAAVELDSRFAELYLNANKAQRPALPTFSLALAAFPDAHWSALLPGRPLRNWHLLEVLAGDALTTSPLRIDERVLHFLTGTGSLDERLRGLIELLPATGTLTASEQSLAQRAVDGLARNRSQMVQLLGSEAANRRAVAARVFALAGINGHTMSVHAIPRGIAELELFLRLWEREAALEAGGLLLEFEDGPAVDAAGEFAVRRTIETLRGPLIVSARERMKPVERAVLSFELPRATDQEQIELWYKALGAAAPLLNGEVATLTAQFSLTVQGIDAAVSQVLGSQVAGELERITNAPGNGAGHALAGQLWDACRTQARPRLEELAQRIEPKAAWDDLILPARQKQLLGQIAVHVRQRAKVYNAWGFGSRGGRGLGINALFAGPSGTGKTMAGEVLANQLRLDLFRIDLSQTISKYIGETEKNLRRVFDAAEESAAVLLFDEADALFGKRSEVKDSHDRYANIEVSYLLQRMESYRGLAILTTNRRDALDTAFLRRIRFVIDFPFPEAAERAAIWQRVFPQQTPTEGLRIDRLARLSAAGGNIQNIAMGAAFLAADEDEPVRMSHLLAAARNEFTKIERPLADSETAGWL
jgi:hypothetical protein